MVTEDNARAEWAIGAGLAASAARTRAVFGKLLVCCLLLLLCCLPAAPAAQAEAVSWAGSELGGSEPFTHARFGAVADAEAVAVIDSNASQYALNANGTVSAWGDNNEGELGDGSTVASETPVTVKLPAGVKAVGVGEADQMAAAITSTGKVYAWGSNKSRALCLRGKDIETPTAVPGLSEVVQIAGGGRHMLYLLRDGKVLACGINDQGQLGIGGEPGFKASTPVEVPGLAEVAELSAGGGDSCARKTDGALFCWGFNVYGEVGVGSSATAIFSPTKVDLPEIKEVYAGGDDNNGVTLALTDKDEVYGWGDGNAGAIGDGKAEDALAPVATGLHYSYVATGGDQSFGITADGVLEGWGSDVNGDLGDGKLSGTELTPILLKEGIASVSSTAQSVISLAR